MYHYNKNLVSRSRDMRKQATRQENSLWYDFLRTSAVRWHRQKIMGDYIVDFHCPKAKLIIELDGAHHLEQARGEYDAERTKYLEAYGYRVIRFSNDLIDSQFASVCETIHQEIQRRIETETP